MKKVFFEGSFEGIEEEEVKEPVFKKTGEYETVAYGTLPRFKLIVPRGAKISFIELNRKGIDPEDENIDLVVIQKRISEDSLPVGAEANKTWVYKVNYGNSQFPSRVEKIYEW